MRAEQEVANAWADRIAQMIVQSVITNLNELPKDCMQSGDDSCLQNVWEEFCVQVQGEESFFWDTYLDIAYDFLEASVAKLDPDEQLALWLVTEPGWSWNYDHKEDKDTDAIAPIAVDEIVTHLNEQLLCAAADYESATIERHLSRLEGEEDEEDEDESGEFDLDDEDRFAIQTAINVAIRLQNDPHTTPKQIAILKLAVEALEQMPTPTEGRECTFGIVYPEGDDLFSEMQHIGFSLSESLFRISHGDSIYYISVDRDSFSAPEWLIRADGEGYKQCDINSLEDTVAEYLNLGARVEVIVCNEIVARDYDEALRGHGRVIQDDKQAAFWFNKALETVPSSGDAKKGLERLDTTKTKQGVQPKGYALPVGESLRERLEALGVSDKNRMVTLTATMPPLPATKKRR